MSIFNPGSIVGIDELRTAAAQNGWFLDITGGGVSIADASNGFYNPGNNLGWFRNKTFRKLKIFNEFADLARINPSTNPRVGLSSPFTLYTGFGDGNNISPKLISHNDYTVTIRPVSPSGWTFQGWYSSANGGGTLLSSSFFLTLGSTSFTSQLNWYGYHITQNSGGGGGGFIGKCLHGDSDILMADGNYKKAKDLQAGEILKSNAVSNKPNTGYSNDWETYVNWNDLSNIPTIQTSDSLITEIRKVNTTNLKVINDGLLKMAMTHPVLVRKGLADGSTGWTVRSAFNIEVGDIILGDNLQHIEVTSAEVEEGDFTLYDIHVDGNDSIHVNNVILPVSV